MKGELILPLYTFLDEKNISKLHLKQEVVIDVLLGLISRLLRNQDWRKFLIIEKLNYCNFQPSKLISRRNKPLRFFRPF